MDPANFAKSIYKALEEHPEGLTTKKLEEQTGLTRNQFATGRKLLQRQWYGRNPKRLLFFDEEAMRWHLTVLPEQAMGIIGRRLEYLRDHVQVELRVCDRLIDERGSSDELEKLHSHVIELLKDMIVDLDRLELTAYDEVAGGGS